MSAARTIDSSEGSTVQTGQQATLRIAGWTVHRRELRLSRNGTSIKLEPKAMDVLLRLAEHPGEAVTREELARGVWPGVIVGDEALSNAVNKLRRAFADDTRAPRVIETIPKVGYRLVAPAEHVVGRPGTSREHPGDETITRSGAEAAAPDHRRDAGSAESTGESRPARRRWILPAVLALLAAGAGLWLYGERSGLGLPFEERSVSPLPDKPSVAVLPFENLGDDPEQSYFSDGLTRDLITDLSRFSGLYVISPSSVFAFKDHAGAIEDVARQLRVDYVLRGSVQRVDQRVRVNAQLVDVDTGYHLWAMRLDGALADLFAVQDKVAGRVVEALSLRLTDNEKKMPTRRPIASASARDSYWQGVEIYGSPSKPHNDLARQMYRRAIALDPQYALAYAGLALTYIDDFRRGWGDSPESAVDEALRHARKAVAIDERLPQAHFALGWVYLYVKGMHEQAMAEARKALALNPSYADAYTLLSSAYFYAGEPDKAFPLDLEAIRLNPAASFLYHTHLGRSYYFQGRYEDALAQLEDAVERNYDYLPTHLWLAAVYARLGRDDDAAWEVDQVLTLEPEFSIGYWVETRPYRRPDQRQKLEEGLRLAGLPD